ncbi:MAG: hypothetical protein KF681_15810 [Bdellovibrionaceae bacterium]|nr:hypothetical protein [Pseudobdellovibrionaceae bacterium]
MDHSLSNNSSLIAALELLAAWTPATNPSNLGAQLRDHLDIFIDPKDLERESKRPSIVQIPEVVNYYGSYSAESSELAVQLVSHIAYVDQFTNEDWLPCEVREALDILLAPHIVFGLCGIKIEALVVDATRKFAKSGFPRELLSNAGPSTIRESFLRLRSRTSGSPISSIFMNPISVWCLDLNVHKKILSATTGSADVQIYMDEFKNDVRRSVDAWFVRQETIDEAVFRSGLLITKETRTELKYLHNNRIYETARTLNSDLLVIEWNPSTQNSDYEKMRGNTTRVFDFRYFRRTGRSFLELDLIFPSDVKDEISGWHVAVLVKKLDTLIRKHGINHDILIEESAKDGIGKEVLYKNSALKRAFDSVGTTPFLFEKGDTQLSVTVKVPILLVGQPPEDLRKMKTRGLSEKQKMEKNEQSRGLVRSKRSSG